jgi:hypothetical protein
MTTAFVPFLGSGDGNMMGRIAALNLFSYPPLLIWQIS